MDIQFVFAPIVGTVGLIDITQDGHDLLSGRTLDSAIIMSLFTNRRADDGDRLPDYEYSKMGWWSDTYNNEQIGSRLWLLHREKCTKETLNRAIEYCKESLAWLTEDGVAKSVKLEVEYDATRLGQMNIGVQVQRPDNTLETYRYGYLWQEISITEAGDENLVYNETVEYLLTEDGDTFTSEDGDGLILE